MPDAPATTATPPPTPPVEDDDDDTVLVLTSKEGDTFELPWAAAKLSTVLAELGRQGGDRVVPMTCTQLSSAALGKVVDFCRRYLEVPMSEIRTPLTTDRLEELVQAEYVDFVTDADWPSLLAMVTAANFLDVRPMLRLCCLAVVTRTVGKTADELRPLFGGRNPPFTEEEREEVRLENAWAVEANRAFLRRAGVPERRMSDAEAAVGNSTTTPMDTSS